MDRGQVGMLRRSLPFRAPVGAAVALTMVHAAASLGCGSGDSSSGPAGDGGFDGYVVAVPVDATMLDVARSGDGAPPTAVVLTSTLTFPSVACGGAPSTEPLTVTNAGSGALLVSATMTGAGFSVTPAMLRVAPGKSATFSVAASVPGSATAGATLSGALNLVTNDTTHPRISVPTSAVAAGASLAVKQGTSSFVFPSASPGGTSSATLSLWNAGTGPGTFSMGAPSDTRFALENVDGGGVVTLQAGQTWNLAADFKPRDTTAVSATSTITATGTLCGGGGLQSVSYSGQGATAQVQGWPSSLDFGPVDCGGARPLGQIVNLTNTGAVGASFTRVDFAGAAGFHTDLQVGQHILANSPFSFEVYAPAVDANAPLTPITATLTIETNQDSSPHVITLTEEPNGAVLAYDTTQTPHFGSFGAVPLLEFATQPFNVTNTGTAPANVTLIAAPGAAPGGDAGAPGDADTMADAGTASPFSLSVGQFSVAALGVQGDSVTFTPPSGMAFTGNLSMVVTGPVCGPLPAPLPLSGTGIGGGTTVAPTSLNFQASCGWGPPGDQSFLVQNNGTADLTWSMTAPTGVGASQYTLSASPPPGLLVPGAASMVTVSAAGIASPAPSTDPTAYAAQVTVTTDVPLDPPHVVQLGEVPIGDQISWSLVSPLRFGQVPINNPFTQTFAITNGGNLASSDAILFFTLAGAGASAYSVTPASSRLSPGGQSIRPTITFNPADSIPFPASLGIHTDDPLCTPLPNLVQLSGTGTQGKVLLSAASLSFGTDPTDLAGLVNCGARGLPHDITVTNVGNWPFHVTGLALGHGASSPYTLSGAGASLPATVPIGGSVSLTITPGPVAQTVANPSDASPFTDTLTITTDAVGDSPHAVQLVMQARGAVIADTPLATSWTFGTISFGSMGTFTSTIKNTGNSGVTVQLTGLAVPDVFTLSGSPAKVPGDNVVTSLVGVFTPRAANSSWSDRGTLTITPDQVLCEPLPAQWNSPSIALSGASNDSPPVTVSGTLAFPTTECGGAAPAGRTVTLTNHTDVAYGYTLSFGSGAFYSSTPAADGGIGGGIAGTLPANGMATIVVTPNIITPGPGVVAGSAAYADDLLVDVQDLAPDGGSAPIATFTVPISWALHGAVLSLPQGAGPDTDPLQNRYYPADSTSGFSLPMANGGTAAVGVSLGIAPQGSITTSPASPIQVLPGVGAAPQLFSTDAGSACPTLTTGAATFFYTGPVCQPFALPKVTIESCAGSL
jgi:hypothetical protein